jgi:hypothetical protein
MGKVIGQAQERFEKCAWYQVWNGCFNHKEKTVKTETKVMSPQPIE